MRKFRAAGIVIAIMLMVSCSGGAFLPNMGPFAGLFTAGAGTVGTLSLTTTSGLVSGTGTLVHNEQQVTVSISGVISGYQIDGSVTNASLGSGVFKGKFHDVDKASGTFGYTDSGMISTTSGTWSAEISDS